MNNKFIASLIALALMLVQFANADTYILNDDNTSVTDPTIADDGETAAIVSTGSARSYVYGTMNVLGDSTINNANRLELQAAITAPEGSEYTITKVGTGQLLFMNDSSAVGKIVVTSGQVVAQSNPKAFNAINGVEVTGGGIQIWDMQNVVGNINLNGGSLQSAGGNNSFDGNITLSKESTIDVSGASYTFTTTGAVTCAGDTLYKLHKSNAGTWEIAGTVKCGYFDVGGGTVKVVKGGVVTGTQLVLRDQDESEHTYTFTVDGGTATFTGDDHRLGHWGRHTGVVNINSGSFSAANTLTVGWDGTGKLYQTGGTASFGTLDIARTGSIIEFSGGTTTIDTLKIGVRGGNSYVEGGKVTFKGDSDVSLTNLYAYHGGTLNIEGNANVTVSNQAYFIQAKNSCTFTANQSGGTFTVNGAMALGHYRNAKVTYNMSGGTLNVPNYDSSQGQSGLWLAVDGSATLNQSGGIINTGRMNLNARDNEQTGTYVMTGGTLNVGTGGIMATQSGTGRYVIKLEKGTITAGASTLTANKGNWTSSLNMELTGTVTTNEGETVDNRVTFKPENGYNITLSGVLSGSGGLIKDGAEKLTLSGNNTYSGGTLVKAGTLAVSNVNSLGTGAVTVNGGTLDASPAGKSKTFANAIVVGENGGTIGVATGDYSSFASISGSGDLTTNGFLHFNGTGGYNGHVTVNSGYLRINPGAFGIFDLTLNGTSNFNVYETGTVQIGKLNSTTSSWLFASDKNRTYIFEIGAGTSSTDTASYSGYIRGSGSNIQNLTIKKVGDGTQTFNLGGVVYGTTTNSIKEVIVVKGKMIIDANNAFNAETTTGFWGTAPITINAGGTLEYNRAWNTSPNVMMTINGGTLTLKAAEYQNAITFNSGTVNGSGQLRVGYVGTGVWNVTGGVTTIENSIVTVKKDSINTFTINIADGATLDIKKNIAGLTDNNSYKGTNLVVNGSGTQGTGKIKFNPAAGSTITDTGTISFNNIQVELDGDAGWLENGYFNKSAVTLTNSTMTTNTDHTTNSTVFTLNNSSLLFDGEVNSYAYQIKLKNGSTIGGTKEGSSFRTGHKWNSQIITEYESGTPEDVMNTISADIAMYDYNKTLTFNIADKAPLTVSGSLIPAEQGTTNKVNKTGAGVLTLTADNDLSYPVTISEGKLVLSGNGTLGTSAVTIAENATLEFAHASDQTFGNAISGTGAVLKSGDGVLTLTAQNSIGSTTISAGKLVLSENGTLGTGAVTNNAELEFAYTTDQIFDNSISGTGAVIKSGDGTLTLTQAPEYTGSTTVEQGTLALSADGTLYNLSGAGDVNYGDNSLTLNNSDNTTFSGDIIGSGAVKKTGSGTLSLSQAPQYTGSTTVEQGTLALADGGTLYNLSGGSVDANGQIAVAATLDATGKDLKFVNTETSKFIGSIKADSIEKLGDGTLQIYSSAENQVDAGHFLVSSGRLDMKDYYKGSMEVKSGATMSPGNSVGTLTIDGEYILETAATLLLEVGKNEQGEIVVDQLIVNGDATFMPGSIIKIELDPSSDLKGGEEFYGVIITANNADAIYSAVEKALTSYYFTDLRLSKDEKNIYLSGRLDPNAVPEPSTWALLILGVAGLMYWRKRKNA